jgi:hypothetical protein
VKPWESYKAQEQETVGLLAALSQEDLDRVSSIYFTQEMIGEEEKVDDSEETTLYMTAKAKENTESAAFMTARTHTVT